MFPLDLRSNRPSLLTINLPTRGNSGLFLLDLRQAGLDLAIVVRDLAP